MSHEAYSKWWILTKKQLEDLRVYEDNLIATTKLKTIRNEGVALVGGLYARYAMVVQEIDTCLDQICQVNLKKMKNKNVLFFTFFYKCFRSKNG